MVSNKEGSYDECDGDCASGNFSSDYRVLHEEFSSCASAMSSSVVSAAPSALRRGKYTYQYYCDSSKEGNSSMGSSQVRSTRSSKSNGYFHPNPRFRLPDERKKKKKNKISPRTLRPNLPMNTTLPNGVAIGESGYILGRTTKMSIMFKKQWTHFVWVHCKPCTILLFGSVRESQTWMENKYLPNDKKKKLLKLAIDFGNIGNGSGKSRDISEVRTKQSYVDGSITHRFEIERLKHDGKSKVHSVFCSADVMEVKLMRKAIRKCMKKAQQPSKKKNSDTRKEKKSNRGDSSYAPSTRSRSNVNSSSHDTKGKPKTR